MRRLVGAEPAGTPGRRRGGMRRLRVGSTPRLGRISILTAVRMRRILPELQPHRIARSSSDAPAR